ncbi:hypothetical protein D3C78_1948790 [compost metagenome]
MRHDLLHFLVRHERTMDTGDAAATHHVQHVALAEQMFGTLFAKDGAAVDL